MTRNDVISFGAAVLCAVLFAGCAKSGPVLLQDIVYQAPTGSPLAISRAVVTVSPLKDVRSLKDVRDSASTLGKRTIGDDIQNDLVVQGTVADLITAALKDALKSQGVTVKDAPAGGQTDAGLLLGGEVKACWVDVSSRPLKVQTKASVQLRVTIAVAPGAAARAVHVQSALTREDVVFSFSTVQETLSEALTSALNQLMTDEELKRQLH